MKITNLKLGPDTEMEIGDLGTRLTHKHENRDWGIRLMHKNEINGC